MYKKPLPMKDIYNALYLSLVKSHSGQWGILLAFSLLTLVLYAIACFGVFYKVRKEIQNEEA